MPTMFIRYKMFGREMIDWNIEEFCGYKPISTYYTDFGIAEWYGEKAIKDTYRMAMKNWKDNIKMVTEIVMVLNWKIHQHYHQHNDKMGKLYNELYATTVDYVLSHFTDEEDLSYYFRTTD